MVKAEEKQAQFSDSMLVLSRQRPANCLHSGYKRSSHDQPNVEITATCMHAIKATVGRNHYTSLHSLAIVLPSAGDQCAACPVSAL